MATVEIDIAKTTRHEDIAKAAGAAITNDVNVTWEDTLTEEELVLTLTRIIGAVVGKNKVTWP